MKLFPYCVFIILYYLVRYMALAFEGAGFYVSFLNIGQGDAFVVNIPTYGKLMIDTGIDYQANYLSARSSPFPLCQIKSVFVTHYDRDHSGGLERITRYCKNITIYDNLSAGDALNFGNTAIFVISPASKGSAHKENDDSLVMIVKHGDFKVMLTGDAGLDVLEGLTNNPVVRKLDVYKVSHHGSSHNNSFKLVDSLKPTFCVISVGRNNYGHPGKETLSDLAEAGCKVYRTDINDSITFTDR